MPARPHVKLNTEQQDKPVTLKFNYGFGPEPVEVNDDAPKDYRLMADAFSGYLTDFRSAYSRRVRERSAEVIVPAHIEYIRVLFQSQFNISGYYNQWLREFGLLGVHFSKFNHEVLFAIQDRAKFDFFLKNIEDFILRETGELPNRQYSPRILYIKEFHLLSTEALLKFREPGQLMNFRLVDDFPLNTATFQGILQALRTYLQQKNIPFTYDDNSKNMEISDVPMNTIAEIVRNFDIVLQVTSALSTVIVPSALNQPERGYGFDIPAPDGSLPIIGILDTGISNQTPLTTILIDDSRFNLTSTSVFSDEANHGTAVAALAALGKKPYLQGYRGSIRADAQLLSMKICDQGQVFLSQRAVIQLLRDAKAAYPSIKLFVLTICFLDHKKTNEDYSSYAFELDRFAHEHDCLISICTANNDEAANLNASYDLAYFFNEATNLCAPAEAMNSLTVGAAAHSLGPVPFSGISTSKEFPTLYSRKGHIDLSLLFPKNKINHLYFKPDVVDCGGDYEFDRTRRFIGAGLVASMEVLSADARESFTRSVGTSFSAPLTANIGAQLLRAYPGLKAQTIKALIINGASLNLIRFNAPFEPILNKTAGHGITDEVNTVYSNDNAVTIVLEESISPEEVKIFPIHFPEYLVRDNLGKKNGILKVNATLCFSFQPLIGHQLAYCPVHMAFCVFKNHTGEEILTKDKELQSLLKSSLRWSQSGRHVGKPIPYTNVQKIDFVVNVQDLVNENGTFKLAVNCRINRQLLAGLAIPYQRLHAFSIALRIEETLQPAYQTGKLYDELTAINWVDNIAAVVLDNEADAEA